MLVFTVRISHLLQRYIVFFSSSTMLFYYSDRTISSLFYKLLKVVPTVSSLCFSLSYKVLVETFFGFLNGRTGSCLTIPLMEDT